MKLSEKLVSIMNSLGSVPKKGYNKNQNYHYMREVDILEALKEELIKNKIILLTSSRFIEMKEKPKTDKNENKVVEFITTVETSHRFIDSESGEELTINSVGSGYDSLDKGASKAITASVKYALMKTFMISDEGADIENDGKEIQPPVEPRKSFGRGPAKVIADGAKQDETIQVTISGPNEKGEMKTEVTPPVTTPVSAPPPVVQKSRFGARTKAAPVKEPNFP